MSNWYSALLLGLYLLAAAISLIIVVLWKKGPNYWPAGRLIAIAAGVPWVYRGFRRAQHWGEPPEDVLRIVNDPRELVLVYGFVLLLLVWVVVLQRRTNRLPPSRHLTPSGKSELEDRDTAIFHLRAAARLLKHRVIDVEDVERVMAQEVGWVDGLERQYAELRAQRARERGR